MNKEEIQKAFEGRWRLKADFGKINNNTATMSFDEFYDYLKGLCFDFFEAGALLADKESVVNPQGVIMIDVERIPSAISANNGFDAWWDKYDKKRGREKCLKKWNKLTDTEKYLCLLRTPDYVESTPDKTYRKDPLTYLNGKCWNDEIIIRHTPEQQRQQRLAEVAERIAGYTKAAK